jgi:demethylmenaquinone methyltransferase/2-methoxy-6-polyprenyl-1,4-benzoquinol methylase
MDYTRTHGWSRNMDKAAFFDDSHKDDWAFRDYTREEHGKLNRYIKLAGVHEGQKILEPGCGTGRLTQKLAGWVGPEGEVAAVDISSKMIQECRKRCGLFPNVRILQGDVQYYDFPPGCFDIIFCLCVFPHFDDKPAILRRFKNLLQPEGALVIAHMEGSRSLNAMHRKVGGAVKRDRIPPFPEVEKMFHESGFRIDDFWDRDDGYYLLAHFRDAARREPTVVGCG